MNNLEIITLNKPGITDFAAERNKLLEKAKTEWILFVDSDEKATPELMEEIKNITNQVPNLVKYDGFYIKRKIFFCKQYVGEDKILRLGRRNTGVWKRAVHEVWDIPNRFGTLQNYIIHNTANNLHEYIDKVNRYSTLHAKENQKERKRTDLFKIIFFPIGKFMITFVKSKNIVFSIMQSFHSFLSWAKMYLLP